MSRSFDRPYREEEEKPQAHQLQKLQKLRIKIQEGILSRETFHHRHHHPSLKGDEEGILSCGTFTGCQKISNQQLLDVWRYHHHQDHHHHHHHHHRHHHSPGREGVVKPAQAAPPVRPKLSFAFQPWSSTLDLVLSIHPLAPPVISGGGEDGDDIVDGDGEDGGDGGGGDDDTPS